MAELLFPLQFKRQYDGPLDADSVFTTEQAMTDYLTSPLRYAGQLGFCEETGKYKYINTTKDAWVDLGGGSSDIDSYTLTQYNQWFGNLTIDLTTT